jgi:hypothetical protein
MTPDDELRRAERAERLFNDPLMQEALKHLESECVRLFHECPPSDAQTLAAVKSMDYFRVKFEAFFRQALANGKLAKAEIERKSLAQRAKDVIRRVS